MQLSTEQCRCCLSPVSDELCFSVTSSDPSLDASETFSRLITVCTGITFTRQEIETCVICLKCRENLLNFYSWKIKVLQVNKTLRLMERDSMLKPQPTEPEPDELENMKEVTKTLSSRELRERNSVAKQLYKRGDDELYHCQTCPTTFAQMGRLLRHLETEHVYPDRDKFTCQLCGEDFPLFKHLKTHHLTVHKEKPYMCGCCGKTFSEYYHVKGHIKRIHLGIKHVQKKTPVACMICGKVLNNKKQMELHHQSFHMVRDKRYKPFLCQICGARLKCQSSFRKHKKKHLEPQEKVPCPQCGKELADKYKLQDHIVRIHENRKDWHCDHCGKFFKSAVSLRLHTATAHSEDRPFKCHLCPDTFKTGQILHSHLKRLHNNLPPVQCDICEKVLKNVLSLKDHKKQHEGKLFECAQCSTTYTSNKALISHIASTHFTFVCLVCEYRSPKKIKVTRHIQEKHQTIDEIRDVNDLMKKIAV